MDDIATTKLSSKGQVVIPENIRKKLKLKPGTRFIVIGENDVIILKNIYRPIMDEFEELIFKARKSAKESGLKSKDIKDAIAKVRNKR